MVPSRIGLSRKHAARVILIGTLSLIGIAGAQAMDITSEQRVACTPDAFRLCSSEIPDIGRVTACMKANRANLSPRCQASFQSAAPAPAIASSQTVSMKLPAAMRQGPAIKESSHIASVSHGVYGPVVIARHHRYAGPLTANAYHRHHRYGWAQSEQAIAIAGQVIRGFGMACASQAIPADVCSQAGSFMGSGGGNLANLMGGLERY